MADTTLMLAGATILAVAVLYFFVGRAVLDPGAPRPERMARNAFALWWFGLAARTTREAVGNLLVVAGIDDVAFHTSLEYLGFVFLFVALAGLMYYLLYLYTGRPWVIYPISVFYGLFLFIAFYLTNLRNAVGLEIDEWSVGLDYASPASPLFLNLLLGALLVPLVIGVVLYLLLYTKVSAPIQKRRIQLVAGALLFWFGSVSIAVVMNLNDHDYWGFVSRVIALIAAVVILYAYTGLEKKAPAADAS